MINIKIGDTVELHRTVTGGVQLRQGGEIKATVVELFRGEGVADARLYAPECGHVGVPIADIEALLAPPPTPTVPPAPVTVLPINESPGKSKPGKSPLGS